MIAADVFTTVRKKVRLSDVTSESRERNIDRLVTDVRTVTNQQQLIPTADFFANARTSEDTKNYKIARPGAFVYNPSRINVGSVASVVGDKPVIVSPMYVVFDVDQSCVLPRYLMHFLTSRAGRRMIEGGVEIGARFRLTYASLSKFVISLPSLQVQQAIVDALGDFERLIDALEEESDLRRLQYVHYADRLVASGEKTSSALLGDVATVVRGASPRPIQEFLTDNADGIPWIKIGDVATGEKYITSTSQRVTKAGAEKSRRVRPGDFVLSNSMSFGRPYISKIDGCIHDGWLAISAFDDAFIPDYLYHLLRSSIIQAEFSRRAGSGAVRNLNSEIVRSVRVPVPSRIEQERVVVRLDGFEKLANDSSSGIPAEGKLRRRQYEYYRDKLLTFEELPA
ncbi:type I restriction enzyme, S subunit [Agrococcus baldri]|uniref:Type I restriction enzyme, S subunit n=1 Tax=Agrococcus baldri TaxID=153730 RepID=A0AA94HN99_9MICO|nr:restriction endonuclease subunit S [Agrococcus baldri]SFS14730.1 type I restriction enzyme, S subunit [Agrococcus baldri]